MTKKEFALFVAALKTYYSKEEKLLPNNQAVELWFNQLNDIPYDVLVLALNKWVATNKWSPSIAEIRATAAEIVNGEQADWGDGWEQVLRAIRMYGSYNVGAALDSLDDITRQCVERIGFREICRSENISVERANFRMLYEQLAERKKKSYQLPASLSQLIEQKQAKQNLLKGEQNGLNKQTGCD